MKYQTQAMKPVNCQKPIAAYTFSAMLRDFATSFLFFFRADIKGGEGEIPTDSCSAPWRKHVSLNLITGQTVKSLHTARDYKY